MIVSVMLMKGITAFKGQRNNLELPVPIDNMFCT